MVQSGLGDDAQLMGVVENQELFVHLCAQDCLLVLGVWPVVCATLPVAVDEAEVAEVSRLTSCMMWQAKECPDRARWTGFSVNDPTQS